MFAWNPSTLKPSIVQSHCMQTHKPMQSQMLQQRTKSLLFHQALRHRSSVFSHRDVALLLALSAADDSTSAHLRDVAAKVLGVDGRVVEAGLDDVGGDGPEAGQDVEGAAVVAVEGADEKGGLTVWWCVGQQWSHVSRNRRSRGVVID
jgi:hypothetical protein